MRACVEKVDVLGWTKSRALDSIWTPDIPNRSDRDPNAKKMWDVIASSSIDPSQTRILLRNAPQINPKEEWGKSIALTTSQINYRFESLQLVQQKVKVQLRCDANIVKMLHKILQTINPDYGEFNWVASQIPKMPSHAKFIDEHVISTP